MLPMETFCQPLMLLETLIGTDQFRMGGPQILMELIFTYPQAQQNPGHMELGLEQI
jgi:hypothetical protein